MQPQRLTMPKINQLPTKNNHSSLKKHQLKSKKNSQKKKRKTPMLLEKCAAVASAIAKTKRTGHTHAVDASQLSAGSLLLVF
jgi:hypothetical protein